MVEIIAAIIGAFAVVLVALIGAIVAVKLGIGTSQEKLVSTLKDLITAQDNKIGELEEAKKQNLLRIQELESRVGELESLTIKYALIIEELKKRG